MKKELLPDSFDDLANPQRLALLAIDKVRYHRPTVYEDVAGLRIFDREAAIADAMLESSLSAPHSLKLKPAIEAIIDEMFLNEDEIMIRRAAKIDQQG